MLRVQEKWRRVIKRSSRMRPGAAEFRRSAHDRRIYEGCGHPDAGYPEQVRDLTDFIAIVAKKAPLKN